MAKETNVEVWSRHWATGDVVAEAICMSPGCGNKISTAGRRGLCQRCYTALNLMVAAKKAKWHKLEKAGKCRPTPASRDQRRMEWLLAKANGK